MIMHKQELYTKNGTLFAREFERVVHGGRGDYIEFTNEQIIPQLFYKYETIELDITYPKPFDINTVNKYTGNYYHWLYPIGSPETKVYFQLKLVKYADYRLGYFYVSPDLFKFFKDPEALF